MKAVEIRDITKRCDGYRLLNELHLVIEEGEAYGLTGPNGSGKSLLLRLIAALERPDRGQIAVLGHDTIRSTAEVRKSVGLVSDRQVALRGLTIIEQLAFIAECRGVRRQERKAAVDDMLELVDLTTLRDQPVTRLSRGQARRLALATAMVHDPTVLLCDEPLEGLDAAGYMEMQEVLAELRAMGKTLVVASNNTEDIARLCRNMGVLDKGSLTTGSALELLNASDEKHADRPDSYLGNAA